MSISLISTGAFVTGLNVTLTPVAGTYQVGDALIYSTGECFGSDNIATPAGWTLLSDDSAVLQNKIFGRVAQTTSETIPGVAWGAVNRSWAQVTAFRGIDPSWTTAKVGNWERGANSINNLIGSASGITPTVDGALVWWVGSRNKTTTTDTTVYSAPANFTIATQLVQTGAGTRPSVALAYWIQTTAAIVPANSIMSGSVSEGVAQATKSNAIYLAPAPPPSGGGGTGTSLFPPTKRKTYVFYDMYYPR